MSRDFQDKIDDYVLGRMSVEERADFEKEVDLDEEKREQLEFTRNVKNAISSRQDKLAKLAKMKARYEHNDKASSMRIWWWVSGIAAALIIGLFVFNPFEMAQTPTQPNEVIRGEIGSEFIIPSTEVNECDTLRQQVGDTTSFDVTRNMNK